jgi:branched-chain amino acid transport system permease protein
MSDTVAIAQRTTSADNIRRAAIAILIACAVSLPWLVGSDQYFIFNAVIALLMVLLATGYNILIGMCGQLSMAHVAFFGIGAYTSALLTRDFGVPFPLAFMAAIALPVMCAWVLAQAAVRLSGPYLAMVTFAFHSMALTIFINWVDVTNGWGGLSRIPYAGVFGFNATTYHSMYLLALAVTLLGLFIAYRLKTSRYGRAFFAIRENRLAAKGVGIDTSAAITIAFCLSGAYAGAAGSLQAHLVRYIDPTSFGLPRLIDLLIVIIIGGRGSVAGVVAASVLYVFSLEYLRFLQDWKLIIFGALLIVLINVSPNGVMPLLARMAARGTGGAKQ